MNLITPGETTAAGISESELSAPIQDALAKKAFLPSEPFLAWGSVDADLMGKSHPDLGLEVIGPMRPDSRWQGKAEQGYDLTHFTVEWQAHQVVCPQGKLNTCWTPHLDAWGTPIISVKFSRTDCRLCPVRSLCTKAAESPRHVTLRVQTDHERLQRVRRLQTTPEWKVRDKRRAGIEGPISQGTRGFGVRRSRDIGEAKTHLHHILPAEAINLVRFASWVRGVPHAKTRTSRFAAL